VLGRRRLSEEGGLVDGGGWGGATQRQVERQRGNPGLTKESEGKMKASFDSVNKLAKQEGELSDEQTAKLQVCGGCVALRGAGGGDGSAMG